MLKEFHFYTQKEMDDLIALYYTKTQVDVLLAALPAGGKIAQTLVDSYSTVAVKSVGFPFDNTKPQRDEGDEILTKEITPLNASSLILIFYFAIMGQAATSVSHDIACLFRSDQMDLLQITMQHPTRTAIFSEPAGSTDARTYYVRVGNSTGNDCYVNDLVGDKWGEQESCQLVIMEISP